jgi:hypothetical protein
MLKDSYMLIFANFADTDDFSLGEFTVLSIFSFIIPLIMMNLLIGMMGEI